MTSTGDVKKVQELKTANDEEEEEEGEGETILEQSLFLSGTLTMLHFTLDVLVHHQYAQEVEWWEIAKRAGIGFPC